MVSKGEPVAITGFAKFVEASRRPARMGRNPATGEAIKIKASKKARITPLKGFKDAVMTPSPPPSSLPASGRRRQKAALANKAAAPARKAPVREPLPCPQALIEVNLESGRSGAHRAGSCPVRVDCSSASINLTERGFWALTRTADRRGGCGAAGGRRRAATPALPRSPAGRRAGQVAVDVLDGGFEHVEPVVEVVELGPGHDELVLGQPGLAGPLAPQVLLLAARSPAELPGPTRALPLGQPPPAPPALLLPGPRLPGRFRH